MDKFYTIRKYSKIFTEGNKQYFFDVPKYMEILLEKGYTAKEITAKIELISEDESKLKSIRTIARVRQFSEGSDHSVKINTIKLVGAALAGDEYAFLEEIDLTHLAKVMCDEDDNALEDLKVIYGMMQQILFEYESSSAYSYLPGTTIDLGFEYYDVRLEKIRQEIFARFVEKTEYRKSLCEILKELEVFVKSYSVPGVVPRWQEISPEIKYFDCVFDLMGKDSQILQLQENGFSFSFIPTREEFIEQRQYFAKIYKENIDKNLKYSEERIFQNQLVSTFEKVFTYWFPEIKNTCGKEVE